MDTLSGEMTRRAILKMKASIWPQSTEIRLIISPVVLVFRLAFDRTRICKKRFLKSEIVSTYLESRQIHSTKP